MTLLSVDPAVIDENSGMSINADLDMYSPKNSASGAGSIIAPVSLRNS